MTAPERDVTGQPDPLAEVLAGAFRSVAWLDPIASTEDRQEWAAYEADAVRAQVAAVREWLAGREAEVLAGVVAALTETVARLEAVGPHPANSMRPVERRGYWRGVRDAMVVVRGQRDAALATEETR